VVCSNSGLPGILLSDNLGSFNSAEQCRVDDLWRFRHFRLDWFRWQFEIAALFEYSSKLHLVKDRLVEIPISLGHPLRASGKENLSSAISARAWILNEHGRFGVLERSLPIIDWLIGVQRMWQSEPELRVQLVLLDKCLIKVLGIVLGRVALVDVLVVIEFLRVG
jgi:hypothetical protein